MRIMGLLRADTDSEAGAPPSPDLIARMGTFMEEVTKAGVVLAADGLHPSSRGKRIRTSNGKVTVIDGPFTESKELIASYALYRVDSWDDAVYWTTRFLEVLGDGECELRPIFEPSDLSEDVFSPEARAQEEEMRRQMDRNAER
jgi:hypothetical protein